MTGLEEWSSRRGPAARRSERRTEFGLQVRCGTLVRLLTRRSRCAHDCRFAPAAWRVPPCGRRGHRPVAEQAAPQRPAGVTGPARGRPYAGVPGADHHAVQAAHHAQDARSTRCPGEVPGHRHSQPSADADLGSAVCQCRARHGRQQPAPARQRERRPGRPAGAGGRRARGEPVQAPHGAVHRHRLPQRRTRLERESGRANSRPT